MRKFIIYHERGHHFYKSELGADLYAFNKMLNDGYNFSQITVIPIKILNSPERVKNILKYLNKTKTLKSGKHDKLRRKR